MGDLAESCQVPRDPFIGGSHTLPRPLVPAQPLTVMAAIPRVRIVAREPTATCLTTAAAAAAHARR